MPEDSYIIRGGVEGRERLRLLSRILRPTTLSLLERVGIRPEMSCVDVGCGGGDVTLDLARLVGPAGRVVGIDVDAIKLDLARQEAAAAGVAKVEFRHVGIDQWRPAQEFDVVYSRFLLTHLTDATTAVRTMRQALRPGASSLLRTSISRVTSVTRTTRPFRATWSCTRRRFFVAAAILTSGRSCPGCCSTTASSGSI